MFFSLASVCVCVRKISDHKLWTFYSDDDDNHWLWILPNSSQQKSSNTFRNEGKNTATTPTWIHSSTPFSSTFFFLSLIFLSFGYFFHWFFHPKWIFLVKFSFALFLNLPHYTRILLSIFSINAWFLFLSNIHVLYQYL